MIRVQFQPIRAGGPRKPTPWGGSTRQSQLGYLSASMLISQGRINNNDVYQKGGVVQQAFSYSIEPQEIVRCTTLAIRRRTELLGPLCKNDPLTEKLVAALSRPIAPPNHWSEAWADVRTRIGFYCGRQRSARHSLFAACGACRGRIRSSDDEHRSVGIGPLGAFARRISGGHAIF